jgi:hypothetical protein
MNQKRSLLLPAATLIALYGAGFAATAEEHPGPATFGSPAAAQFDGAPGLPPLPGAGAGPDEGFMLFHGPGLHPAAGGPPQEVIHTLIQIEQLYRQQGRGKDVVPLYLDVLGRTKDPMVRRFAYDAIVRAQLQPADVDKALATLKQSLDESLTRLNQMQPPAAPAHEGKAQ